jgi:hypothetical protein
MKSLSLAVPGFIALTLALAAPSTSNAQPYYSGGYSYWNAPRYNYSSYYGNSWYGGYSAPSYGYYNPGYSSYYRSYRPAIVHPETLHWTPRRGWHTHGHIHVPHRGHYHTHPY